MTDAGRGATAQGVWEFDPRGAVDPRARDRLISDIGDSGARDVLVLAHGWNNDPAVAGEFDARFFALIREAAPGGRMAQVGVRWPAMRFLDESAPHVPEEQRRAALDALPALDAATARALVNAFPASGDVVHELCDLLARRPAGGLALDDFGTLLRRLVELRLTDARAEFASDAEDDLLPQHDPVMLFDDTAGVCGEFASALDEAREAVEATHHRPERTEQHSEEEAADVSHHGTHAESAVMGPRAPDAPSPRLEQGGPVQTAGGFGAERFATGHDELWRGAHELLRQVAGHTFRRRAGVVGTYGLAPVLALLARSVPGVRIHLVGHGFGARLVAYALRSQAEGSRTVASMVLLQPALSHFAFADHMPHQMRGGGALAGCVERLAGPLVCCYSHNDLELGLMHPLATRMIGDSASLSGIDRKWGALGHDGAQAAASFTAVGLDEVLSRGMGDRQCLNVDVSAVVREGDPPAGAHNDVFHRDLARLVVEVAGIGRED
ncbi:serine-threonine protein kinase [Streptomyces mesophilus]|uniref:serine-threonine protein kinase n=1 Tax=Streptomyces mesophilus TaxID=1775132 RepID=UPI0033285C80